jgi:putative ABC transport system permease protein
MFRHLLKPLWKRKSRNLMLTLELLLAFIVVFAIAAASTRYYQLYSLPTGFAHESVWSVQMERAQDGELSNESALYDQLKRSLEAMPEIERVAFADFSPYVRATWQSGVYLPDSGAEMATDMMHVSDDFFAALDMDLQQGQWFSSSDEGSAELPVVINRRLADAMFPGQDAVGKRLSEGAPGSDNSSMLRITGVIGEFRNHGELMTPGNFILKRFSPLSSRHGVSTLLLKLRPGTGRIFEVKLNEQLKLIRNDRSYRISPLTDLRSAILGESIIPLIVLSVIAAFLLLMVAFGLFGVLWQNTTRRIPEIGMRRAAGATALQIYWQIVVEQLLLSSAAMAVGLILLVQLPITGVFGDQLNWAVFLIAALVSVALMALVSVLCALYPAWRASRMSPTEALRYE